MNDGAHDERSAQPETDGGRGAAADSAAGGQAPSLPERAQRINSWVVIVNTSVGYFVAPVFYVGVLHAAILSSAGFSDTIANLPLSVYFWTSPLPVVIAWLWPATGHFRRMWGASYLLKGATGVLAALLFVAAPTTWQAAGVVLHAASIGAANGITNMCQWELLGRGMTDQRRAWTLGITFGVGPVFAVLGSCASQLILSGNFLDVIVVEPVARPWSYVVLFGVTGPAMLISAVGAWFATLPAGDQSSEPRASLSEVRSGLRSYFTNRLLLIALAGFLLTSAGGNLIMNNIGLFARETIGESPENYTGVQLALRFGCKSLCGFFLGWLLARFQLRTPALATTLICIAGVAWALVIPGKWYLFSFGLLGAGELFYVYYLNYIIACSPPTRVREFTAYSNVLMGATAFVPLMYGVISDVYGLRASFLAAEGILIATLAVMWMLLPASPGQPATPTRPHVKGDSVPKS